MSSKTNKAFAIGNDYDEHISEPVEFISIEETDKDENPKEHSGKKIFTYAKKIILEHLKNEDEIDIDKIGKKIHCPSTLIEAHVNKHARLSQLNVHYECDSPSFRSVNKWLDIFKEKGFNTLTENETGLIMKSIAIFEDHPDPSECNGINFQHLYKFLGNIMNGEPTLELNEPTKIFLSNIFQELIDDVNSDQGDENLEKLKETLLSNGTDIIKESEKFSSFKDDTFLLGLDPLDISSIASNNLL